MNRREFLVVSAGALTGHAAARKPNIILLFADDLGYGELGVQGSKDIPTPNIDSIAKNGVRFTNGYVSCPVCSPTRAGLMTGRYQQRFGHEFNPGPAEAADDKFGLPLTEVTIADRLKSLGYRTGIVGKWHLGYKPELNPTKRGFDEFFGFPGGAHDYFDPLTQTSNPILRGTGKVDEKEYLTDAFCREALAFIDRHQKETFFLYLPFNAVHAPMQAPDKYTSRFASIQDQRRRMFAAMLSGLDDAVGAVLKKVRDTGLENDTLIFFISDNGGPTPSTTSGNGPLRGTKATVYEGGIRVPFLMQWKGKVPGGKVCDHPVIALDVHPTAVAAAGGKPAANLDGVNLLPYLTGSKRPHETLCWRYGPQSAIRLGDWKVARLAGQPPQLYNLAADIGESKDLASSDPGKLKELLAAYDAWEKQMIAPRWVPADRGRAGKEKNKQKRK